MHHNYDINISGIKFRPQIYFQTVILYLTTIPIIKIRLMKYCRIVFETNSGNTVFEIKINTIGNK